MTLSSDLRGLALLVKSSLTADLPSQLNGGAMLVEVPAVSPRRCHHGGWGGSSDMRTQSGERSVLLDLDPLLLQVEVNPVAVEGNVRSDAESTAESLAVFKSDNRSTDPLALSSQL